MNNMHFSLVAGNFVIKYPSDISKVYHWPFDHVAMYLIVTSPQPAAEANQFLWLLA